MNILDKDRYDIEISRVISAIKRAMGSLALAQILSVRLKEKGYLCCSGKIDLASFQVTRILSELMGLEEHPKPLPKNYPEMSPFDLGY